MKLGGILFKHRLRLILPNHRYDRTWLEFGIVNELKKHYDVSIIYFSDLLTNQENKRGIFLRFIILSYTILHLVSIHNSKNRSLAINFAIERVCLSDNILTWNFTSILNYLRYIVNRFIAYPLFFIMSIKLVRNVFEYFANLFLDNLSILKFLKIYYPSEKYLLISGMGEPYLEALLRDLKKYDLKSILAIENWDNIYSKKFFVNKPDFIFVMGENSAFFAKEKHGFSEEQVFIVGSPRLIRYDNLNHSDVRNGNSGSTKLKITYLGMDLISNELDFCNQIQKLLTMHGISFSLIYRAHPMKYEYYLSSFGSEKRDFAFSSYERDMQTTWQTNNGKDISLLVDSDLVISSCTTMALESLLLKRPTIIDAHEDLNSRVSHRNLLFRQEHFSELLEIGNLKIAYNLDDILIYTQYLSRNKVGSVNYDLRKIIKSDYINNLLKTINFLINHSKI